LKRSFDAQAHEDLKADGRRTYASQILETTAVNLKWAQTHGTTGEIVMYEKHPSAVPGDTGERLVKYRVKSDGTIERQVMGDSPKITAHELQDIHSQITGRNDTGFVIHGPGYGASSSGKAIAVASAEDFGKLLEQMEAQKQFPAILVVDTRHSPFRPSVNDPAAGGAGGGHVITIQGIYKDAAGHIKVEFSNQWGAKYNHLGDRAIPLEELFEATKPVP
jgi:hypothetical protein